MYGFGAASGWYNFSFDIHQFHQNTEVPDGKTYFVYVPPGIPCTTSEGRPGVWKLNLMMQGMRPAARFADEKLDELLTSKGISKALVNLRLYTMDHPELGKAAFEMYADDGDGFCEREAGGAFIKEVIETHYKISAWGPIQFRLGFEVERNMKERTITITAKKFIESGVRMFLEGDVKITPKMPYTAALTKEITRSLPDPMSPEYANELALVAFMRRLVGHLLHVKWTRPEVAMVASVLGQHVIRAQEHDK